MLSFNRTNMDVAWLLVGDFNITVHPLESFNSSGPHVISADMREFIEVREQLAIFDHAYSGPLFTWFNKQQKGFLARKLDRALVNDDWISRFANSTVEFLSPEVSDHCLVIVSLHHDCIAPPKPFKFFNYWVRHPDFWIL